MLYFFKSEKNYVENKKSFRIVRHVCNELQMLVLKYAVQWQNADRLDYA